MTTPPLDHAARVWVAAALSFESKRARQKADRSRRRGERLDSAGNAMYAEACRVAAQAYSEIAESYALKAAYLRRGP